MNINNIEQALESNVVMFQKPPVDAPDEYLAVLDNMLGFRKAASTLEFDIAALGNKYENLRKKMAALSSRE